MPNPNKNKHFNDEALKINRTLKKENDALSEIVDEFENFLLNYDVEEFHTEIVDKIKDMILKVRSRDGK
tara:strand:+ start:178 stop:384 length:207 start_codon:yes stop_codon:yes gene_type:complete